MDPVLVKYHACSFVRLEHFGASEKGVEEWGIEYQLIKKRYIGVPE
jgi:hypothetical protein